MFLESTLKNITNNRRRDIKYIINEFAKVFTIDKIK
jgi:hypothetical protein